MSLAKMHKLLALLALALAVANDGAAFLVPALRGVAAGAVPSLPSFCLRAEHSRRPAGAVAARARAEALCSRRNMIVGTAAALLTFAPAKAADSAQLLPGETQADGVGERVRQAASKMPGMGPPDVVYPDGVIGRWRVQRVLADVDFPQGTAKADAQLAEAMLARMGRADAFEVRFIKGKGGVVADREFNMRSLTAASEGAGVAVQWKASNPNVLTVQYPDGQIRETKVCAPNLRVRLLGAASDITVCVIASKPPLVAASPPSPPPILRIPIAFR
jgi:hypothetical protein